MHARTPLMREIYTTHMRSPGRATKRDLEKSRFSLRARCIDKASGGGGNIKMSRTHAYIVRVL